MLIEFPCISPYPFGVSVFDVVFASFDRLADGLPSNGVSVSDVVFAGLTSLAFFADFAGLLSSAFLLLDK